MDDLGTIGSPGCFAQDAKACGEVVEKVDPDRIVKVEDHLDTFYLHLWTLKVHYDDIACRLFFCTLDG